MRIYGISHYYDEKYGSYGFLEKKNARWSRLASGIKQLKQNTMNSLLSPLLIIIEL